MNLGFFGAVLGGICVELSGFVRIPPFLLLLKQYCPRYGRHVFIIYYCACCVNSFLFGGNRL